MLFNELEIGIKYRSNVNNIPNDFLIPVLKNAKLYKRAVGYFSTSALIDLSVGIFKMAQIGGKIQIVCSPRLSTEDLEAINLGYKTKEKVLTEALDISLTNPITEFEKKRLNLIATLIANGMLEVKLAFMETSTGVNLYHEKIAVIYDEVGNRISFTGSMNETDNGFVENFESIYVFCDWKNDQKQFVDEADVDFDLLWNNTTEKIKVIDFPQVIINKLKGYQNTDINYNTDFEQYDVSSFIKKGVITIPNDVELLDYQIEAITSWKQQSYRGIYDMATGTGKSFTALGSIVNLSKCVGDKLATFIVCPYIHLVGQWEEDVVKWGINPIIAHSQSPDKKWDQHLIGAYKHFRSTGKSFICITTNATFSGEKVQKIMNNVTSDMNMLLIIDEAHNFGASHLSKFLNNNIKYRLALSATIERYMDKKGTQKLFNFFGERCIYYPLEQAIKEGKTLVEYEYHLVYAFLSPDELKEYSNLTKQLKKFIIQENGKTKFSDSGKMILFKRSRILAGAEEKIKILSQELKKIKNEKFILVYCGATGDINDETGSMEKQIQTVGKMIEHEVNMRVHKFTAEEDAEERIIIKKCFADGLYQVLTAIKCLDEGVNIPNIQTAFILSSSRNPKQFIQRRGRLLRKAKGKKKAIIYDFVTLPRRFNEINYGDFEEDKSIIIGELARINEFGSLALNKIDADNVIDEIQEAYGVSIDIDEEIKRLEEEFNE